MQFVHSKLWFTSCSQKATLWPLKNVPVLYFFGLPRGSLTYQCLWQIAGYALFWGKTNMPLIIPGCKFDQNTHPESPGCLMMNWHIRSSVYASGQHLPANESKLPLRQISGLGFHWLGIKCESHFVSTHMVPGRVVKGQLNCPVPNMQVSTDPLLSHNHNKDTIKQNQNAQKHPRKEKHQFVSNELSK